MIDRRLHHRLHIKNDSTVFLPDGSGGFTTSSGGSIGNGSGSTETDYVPLAHQTGGAAWDLNLLRAGGNTATSFAKAFIDVKVQEITTPPTPTLPLDARDHRDRPRELGIGAAQQSSVIPARSKDR